MQYVYLVSDSDRAIAIKAEDLMFAEMHITREFRGMYGGGGHIMIGYRGGMEKMFKYNSADRLIEDYRELLETLGAIESQKEQQVNRAERGILRIEQRIVGNSPTAPPSTKDTEDDD